MKLYIRILNMGYDINDPKALASISRYFEWPTVPRKGEVIIPYTKVSNEHEVLEINHDFNQGHIELICHESSSEVLEGIFSGEEGWEPQYNDF